MSRIPYQTSINGMPFAAKVTTIKDRHGNLSYQATVSDDKNGAVIAVGYGDTPAEACDSCGGK